LIKMFLSGTFKNFVSISYEEFKFLLASTFENCEPLSE